MSIFEISDLQWCLWDSRSSFLYAVREELLTASQLSLLKLVHQFLLDVCRTITAKI